MANRCEKCGQIVQKSDTSCWHCGAVLVENSSPPPTTFDDAAGESADGETISLTAVIFYAVATAVCLFLLTIIVRILNQQPLFQFDLNIRRPPGWTAVTDSRQRFTFNVPPDWSVYEPGSSEFVEETAVLEQLLESSGIDSVIQMKATELVAVSPENVMMHVNRIPAMTSNMLESFAGHPNVQAVQVSQNTFGQQQVRGSVTISSDGVVWRCKIQVFTNQPENYAILICGPESKYSQIVKDIDLILNSFQPLLP